MDKDGLMSMDEATGTKDQKGRKRKRANMRTNETNLDLKTTILKKVLLVRLANMVKSIAKHISSTMQEM